MIQYAPSSFQLVEKTKVEKPLCYVSLPLCKFIENTIDLLGTRITVIAPLF